MFSYSVAHLVWFQDNFRAAEGGGDLDKIRGLDWTAVAMDVSD